MSSEALRIAILLKQSCLSCIRPTISAAKFRLILQQPARIGAFFLSSLAVWAAWLDLPSFITSNGRCGPSQPCGGSGANSAVYLRMRSHCTSNSPCLCWNIPLLGHENGYDARKTNAIVSAIPNRLVWGKSHYLKHLKLLELIQGSVHCQSNQSSVPLSQSSVHSQLNQRSIYCQVNQVSVPSGCQLNQVSFPCQVNQESIHWQIESKFIWQTAARHRR